MLLIDGRGYTIDWLISIINQKFETNNYNVDNLNNFTATDITGGVAFCSKILRVNFDWNCNVDDRKLLSSIILKVKILIKK